MIFTTPESTLTWTSLAEWHDRAWQLEGRRASHRNNRLKELHVQVLPLFLIYECDDHETLSSCLSLLLYGPAGFVQPLRGHRQNAPQTLLIVAIRNRLAQMIRQDDIAAMPDGHNSRERPLH